jgi:hypothetical protein
MADASAEIRKFFLPIINDFIDYSTVCSIIECVIFRVDLFVILFVVKVLLKCRI